ncbi:hypothetical protein FOMPIDRAFT_1019160 [Fomitopsis schrenkii]|uniref:Uncharacterized protein n=1 Tax=Fomitopsis schrenkii TaxID=2126942 RepID=S8F2E5_FOMSC|nr:hypothetical protein FOMPIDRAFT_1019160 [Fomitopsis schrenkii]
MPIALQVGRLVSSVCSVNLCVNHTGPSPSTGRTQALEDVPLVVTEGFTYEVPGPMVSDIQQVSQKPVLSVLRSSTTPLVRKASKVIPIRPPAAFLLRRRAQRQSQRGPGLYNLGMYALSSAPIKRHRPTACLVFVTDINVPKTTKQHEVASPVVASTSGSQANNHAAPEKDVSHIHGQRYAAVFYVDAIEIAEKADRRSRNLADLILLLDKFGVTGVAQSEDRSATVAATGTHSAEDVRGTLEVPEREVLDDSQGKQVGTRDGGVSAAFDGAGDVPRYSHKLDDIVALLGLPEVCNTAPDVYGLEHAGDVGSRENSYQVGLHCLS